MDRKHSYTAAGDVPFKLMANEAAIKAIEKGYIPPVHVQLMPTNKCNLGCSFCSCLKRKRDLEMPFEEMVALVPFLANKGCQAVTITGGGEPLLYPHIGSLVGLLHDFDIKVGLVTNGIELQPAEWLKHVSWCRISASDDRRLESMPGLMEAVKAYPNVDWAFSYVLTVDFDIVNLEHYIDFAETMKFTHVRVVADLMHPHQVDMAWAARLIAEAGLSRLAIFQPRTEYTHGRLKCLISLLKPVIDPEGMVYPCCGVQYARQVMDLDMPKAMRMGTWHSLGSKRFDGSNCERCYYDGYNLLLEAMTGEYDHGEFV